MAYENDPTQTAPPSVPNADSSTPANPTIGTPTGDAVAALANPSTQATPAAPATKAAPSNAPDTDTKAAASIPANLVNNPQVPSQKIASTVDANKTSPAPKHTMLYKAAQELAGGPRYTTTYDAAGNPIRKEVPVSPAHLGLALAMEVLSGGMAGLKAPANQPGQAFEAGQQAGEKQRAAVQKANQDQEAQAKSDFQFKRSITEANMRNYQTAVNVGNSTKDASQKFADSFKPIAEGIQDGTIALPEGVTKDEAFETDAIAALGNNGKNGKTNITHDVMIPVGDPLPVMDQNGQQKTVNGIPVWGHNYVTIHGADKFQTTLTKDMQDKLHEIGMFQQDGKNAEIGEPQWSFADIANKMSIYASVKAGEQLLTDHKNDAHDILGRKPEDLDNLATAVRTNPAMRKAVGLFAQAQQGTAGGSSRIEDILGAMATKDPQAASTLMNYLKLSPKDIDDMRNKRIEADTEAKTKEPQPKALTPVEIAEKTANVEEKLSTVAKNKSEKAKLDAETDKLLKDKESEGDLTDAIGTGHVTADRLGYILARKPEVLEKVIAKYPDFDSTKANDYPKVSAEFKSTKKNTAGYAINAGSTAFKHLAELQTLNTDQSRILGTKDYQKFQDKLDTLASELAAFYGNNTIPGIQGYKDTLGATFNRDAAITTQAQSMADKMNSYEHQWYNAAPSAVYQAPIPWMDSEALHARAKLDPTFKTRVPEGAAGQATINGKPFWVNRQMKPIQEVVQ